MKKVFYPSLVHGCVLEDPMFGRNDSDQWRRRCYGNPARVATQNRSPVAETSQTKLRSSPVHTTGVAEQRLGITLRL